MATRKNPAAQLKVWIELERPAGDDQTSRDADAARIGRHANRMLQRLMPGTGLHFFWSDRKAMWAFGDQSFTYLSDSGTWLNLEHVGRDLEPDELERGLVEPKGML
jgi:hypothetical protein